jgi:hypothetical protein
MAVFCVCVCVCVCVCFVGNLQSIITYLSDIMVSVRRPLPLGWKLTFSLLFPYTFFAILLLKKRIHSSFLLYTCCHFFLQQSFSLCFCFSLSGLFFLCCSLAEFLLASNVVFPVVWLFSCVWPST